MLMSVISSLAANSSEISFARSFAALKDLQVTLTMAVALWPSSATLTDTME